MALIYDAPFVTASLNICRRQHDGHGASINKLSAPFNRLNFVVMPKAKHFKAAAYVHSQLFADKPTRASGWGKMAAPGEENRRCQNQFRMDERGK
jgi:hypothetical protein